MIISVSDYSFQSLNELAKKFCKEITCAETCGTCHSWKSLIFPCRFPVTEWFRIHGLFLWNQICWRLQINWFLITVQKPFNTLGNCWYVLFISWNWTIQMPWASILDQICWSLQITFSLLLYSGSYKASWSQAARECNDSNEPFPNTFFILWLLFYVLHMTFRLCGLQ